MRAMRRFGDWADNKWFVRGLLFPIYVTAILLGLAAAASSWWWLLPFAVGLAAGSTIVVVSAVARDPEALDNRLHLR